MNKFKGVLICTDLDGTLLKKDKSISKENLEAIEHFKAEGGLFTIVTGRMHYTTTDICEILKPNIPFGCINGGGLYDYDKKELIWCSTLSKNALEMVYFVADNMPDIGIQINTADKIHFYKDNYAMEMFRFLTNTPYNEWSSDAAKQPIAKILFATAHKDRMLLLTELLNNHPLFESFDFIHSERTLYELLPKGISKATSLEKLKGLYSNITKTIAVGDYFNDATMLKAADVGVAVSNAPDEVKEIADYVTVSNEEHAIAKIINDLEKGII